MVDVCRAWEEAFDGLKIRAPCHAFDEIDFESFFLVCGGGLSFRSGCGLM
jgi:hypothetical protein